MKTKIRKTLEGSQKKETLGSQIKKWILSSSSPTDTLKLHHI